MKAHDLQASVLNEHPPVAFDKQELRMLCLPRRIVIAAKKLLSGGSGGTENMARKC